jgi:hypothetical protein
MKRSIIRYVLPAILISLPVVLVISDVGVDWADVFTVLSLALIAWLILGLIDPKRAIAWGGKQTRLAVAGYFSVSFVILSQVAASLTDPVAEPSGILELEMPQTDPASPYPLLPGVSAEYLTNTLEPLGFSCSGPDPLGNETYWTCEYEGDGYDYNVKFYGREATSIRKITATSINYSYRNPDDVARVLIGRIASLPYEGAQPGAAKAWADTTVRAGHFKRTFGGIPMALDGTAGGRVLTVGYEFPQ